MTHKIEDLMAQNVHEQELKRKSELKALQSQINPHFFIIRWIPLSGWQKERNMKM